MGALAIAVSEAVGAEISWEPLLVDRAQRRGFGPQGRTSANGTCRLLRAVDGWFALSAARPEDREAFAALVEKPHAGWAELEMVASQMPRELLVARARLLGMPAATLATPSVVGPGVRDVVASSWTEQHLWPATLRRDAAGAQVVDLSSLWAGPLACSLLARTGASVVKVQSASRPNPSLTTLSMRSGMQQYYESCETVDFSASTGRRRLRGLLESADIVIEGSRPRALEQVGCSPESLSGRPGRVWLSITGYGRQAPNGSWVAFGDDAAVAGGLVGRDEAGDPVFCGDAISDPLTGLIGALAVLRAVRAGGGVLIDVAMARCAGTVAGIGG